MLEARHLVKRFFGTAVVNDVSFEVRAGEVVGIEPSVGSRGDSYDNALAESAIGLFKTEVSRLRGLATSRGRGIRDARVGRVV